MRSIFSLLLVFLSIQTVAHAQEAPWAPDIEGRQYFAVITADIESAVEWYTNALGLDELDRWTSDDQQTRIINMRSNALFVEIIQRLDALDVDRAQGFFKVGFEVPDLAEVADRVGEATGERPRVLDFPDQDMRLLQIRDPDGNILQIFEALTD